jgi:hypothetical protein
MHTFHAMVIRERARRSMAAFVAVAVITACGQTGGASDGEKSVDAEATTTTATTATTTTNTQGRGSSTTATSVGTEATSTGSVATSPETPTEELVVLTLGGINYDMAVISICDAIPGFSLEYTAGDVEPKHVGGGFRIGQGGMIRFETKDGEWEGGTNIAGTSLDFDLIDQGGESDPWVTVESHGTAVSNDGSSVDYQLVVTCRPDGS